MLCVDQLCLVLKTDKVIKYIDLNGPENAKINKSI